MKEGTGTIFGAKQLAEMLRRRLQFHSIFREVALLPHVTPALELQLGSFRRMEILAFRSDEEMQGLLVELPFLKVFSKEGKGKMVRFQYKFSPGMLVVTGIHEQPLLRLLGYYEQSARKPKQSEACKEGSVRRTFHNGFFTMIEAYTKENALNLQSYLRNRKKAYQDQANSQFFKMENRRVRIFSIGEENLYGFIMDMMSEYKTEKFMKSMEANINLAQRCPTRAGSLIYRPFSTLAMQMPVISHQHVAFNQPQSIQGELLNKEEDVSSDSTCFTSENVDKMQDVVEEEPLKLATEVIFLSLEEKEE